MGTGEQRDNQTDKHKFRLAIRTLKSNEVTKTKAKVDNDVWRDADTIKRCLHCHTCTAYYSVNTA